MTLAPLALILGAFLTGVPGSREGAPFLPVAEARERAANHAGQQVCVQGVVTVETGVLQPGPWDFYLQDTSGGIFVRGVGPDALARGAAVAACGTLGNDGTEPELGRAEVRVLGKARLPSPDILTIAQALDGVSAGKLVKVRGRVQRVSIGETRDVMWLGEEGPVFRVYLRRKASVPSALPHSAPIGGEVEVTGILLPEEKNKFQIRLRGSSDVVLVASPEDARVKALRLWLFAAAVLGLGIGLWVALLRRAVRRQTAEIRRLMIEARQSEEAKSRFLANMSHEIRTPLNGIMGMTELALESDPGPEQRSYLETIRSSARALLEIVNDVLDLSRIEKGQMRLEPQPFELRQMIDELLPLIAVQAQQKGLRLEVRFDGRLPETVMGDAGRLRQVLVNLLGNAVKFTASGWIRLEVEPEGEGKIRFTVADSGPGIPHGKQKEIFRAFVQGDGSSTRQYGGSGLGLTISDHLVRMMGGEMELESAPGRGARFSFSIRLPNANGGAAPAEDFQEAECLVHGLRILVAEDNDINRRTLDSLLRRDGHFPRFATNGAEAVELARTERFDAILMDVQMPEVDGLEATRRIRAIEAAEKRDPVPVIGLTAHAFPEDVQRCRAAGMTDYLAKPYHIDDLRRLLADCSQRTYSGA
ncbi:MAG: ATP-binding protein [Acidobacteriota bacterium]